MQCTTNSSYFTHAVFGTNAFGTQNRVRLLAVQRMMQVLHARTWITFSLCCYLELLVRGRVGGEGRRSVDLQQPRLEFLVEENVVAVQPETMLVVDHHL